MKKGIGLGIDDFKEIIKEDCYYFDKTNWIEELLKDRTKIKLFTRPRRFGKTLNMSTLKYFFDVKNAEENRKLFKDLYIEKSEYFKEQGQYPVIFISLKDCHIHLLIVQLLFDNMYVNILLNFLMLFHIQHLPFSLEFYHTLLFLYHLTFL